ncbi:MAG TPA: DUF6089 family protein [Phaeodactylibacter sp.]|nr:DUF6089 family protein [Phaeodactylibacter sp.]
MRKQCKLLVLSLFALTLWQPDNHAQTSIGVMGGVSLYSGDLSPQEFGIYLEELRPAFGAFARIEMGRAFALRPSISIGQVTGDDFVSGREDRGLSFRSRITELALIGELNLFKIGARRNRGLIPYLFGGGAVFFFNPETEFDGDYIELQPLGTEGQGLPNYPAPYQLTQVAVPLGVGIKFMLNENLTISVEFGGRKLFTDYLDDVSDTEVNYFDVLENNGELAAQLSNPTLEEPEENATYSRGGAFNDWYYIGGLSFAFRLNGSSGGNRMRDGRNIGCPTF